MEAERVKTRKDPSRVGQTAMEIAQQINDARQMLAMGRNRYTICQALTARYGLSIRTADRRLREARETMVEEWEAIDRKQLAAQLIEAASEILGEARESKQLSNALGALGFISRITKLED
jgi:hypothetical protein